MDFAVDGSVLSNQKSKQNSNGFFSVIVCCYFRCQTASISILNLHVLPYGQTGITHTHRCVGTHTRDIHSSWDCVTVTPISCLLCCCNCPMHIQWFAYMHVHNKRVYDLFLVRTWLSSTMTVINSESTQNNKNARTHNQTDDLLLWWFCFVFSAHHVCLVCH